MSDVSEGIGIILGNVALLLSPGTAAAAGRRQEATLQEQKGRRARQAMLLNERQGSVYYVGLGRKKCLKLCQ